MAKSSTTKIYRTFVKGLITEVTSLTYPEDASADEDNCIITRKGNRTRRLGLQFEPGGNLSPFGPTISAFDTQAIKEFVWEAVDNQPNLNFLVLQVGVNLHFWDLSAVPLSSGLKSFTYQLTPLILPSASTPFDTQLSFSAGKGYLFCCGPKTEPFYISYDPVADDITVTQIYIKTRDFVGLDDGLDAITQPATLSPQHHYNLRNQGWTDPNTVLTGSGTTGTITGWTPGGGPINIGPIIISEGIEIDAAPVNTSTPTSAPGDTQINEYFQMFQRYPANNQQWWVGQATFAHTEGTLALAIGDFDPQLLAKFDFGTGRAPRGSMIMNAFDQDYSGVSGVSGLPKVTQANRPTSTTFFSGRVWFGYQNTVYFSQILDDVTKAGNCYQEGDPTSQFTPDLVATDGGSIQIPEMINIIAMQPLGQGVVVFASNGVWFITGSAGGFSAVDVAQSKISPVGIISPNCLATVEHSSGTGSATNNTIFYWSKVGIQSIAPAMGSFGPLYGYFQRDLVSLTTIQTFFNDDISPTSKSFVKTVYDPATQVIQWFFKTPSNTSPYRYDRVLNLDLTLNSFYPWTITSDNGTPWLIGAFTTPYLNVTQASNFVTEADGGTVTDSIGDIITTNENTQLIQNTFFKYICITPNFDTGNYHFGFAFFNNTNYTDWHGFNGTGFAYNSYMVTGFELMEDAMRYKQTPYVITYFNQTENTFVPVDGSPGDFTLEPASSCLFSAQWDYSSSAVSNKFTTPTEAYRLKNIPMFAASGGVFDNGYSTVVTKSKVRGRGRAVQFKLENNSIGSGFDILGWAVEYTGGSVP